jgi:hypothetical protein
MKVIVPTPKGNIEVIQSTDPAYPGVYIEIEGKQVALIDYDCANDEFAARVWNGNDEDYEFRQIYKPKPWAHEMPSVKTTVLDVIGTMESMMESENIPELTDSQLYEVARRVHDGYSHSDYDEYISDVIRGVLSGEF